MTTPASALIVDDEAHVRLYVRLLLAELGIRRTWEAANGAIALELAREHSPELVLLDVNLPVMGGLETLAQLKSILPDVPVVMVSSENALQTVREAARLGAAGYVLKQSPRAEALQALREALDLADEADTDGEA